MSPADRSIERAPTGYRKFNPRTARNIGDQSMNETANARTSPITAARCMRRPNRREIEGNDRQHDRTPVSHPKLTPLRHL